MKECEWNRIKKGTLSQSSISSLLYRGTVSQDEMLSEILTDRLYGFAVVDIIPTLAAKKFTEFNWLPIVRHDEIQFDDLPEFMKNDNVKKSFPRKTLVQTMHATKLLLHTRLIQWYVVNIYIL